MRTTDEIELLGLTGITTLSLLVYSSGYKKNLINDFLFCVVPQYYSVVYPDQMWNLGISLLMMIDYSGLKRSRMDQKSTVIDYLRFTISTIVTIVIYAVDFPLFDHRLGKSDFFGLRLMDVGVGSFIYSAGVVGYKSKTKKYLKSCPILIILGFIRYLVVKYCGLHVNPREYGLHLNFYFLLSLVNAIYCIIRSRYNFIVGLLLITIYEIILNLSDLSQFILNDDRNTFIEANKEGLVAIIPYLSIFLMATEMGRIYLSSGGGRALKSCTLTLLFGCLYMMFNLSNEGCRRLGNGSFVFWVLTLHSVHTTMYLFLESVCGLYNTMISRFSSSNMMFVFLSSNLMVLLGKILFDLDNCSSLMSHIHLLSYLMVIFLLSPFLSSIFNSQSIRYGE